MSDWPEDLVKFIEKTEAETEELINATTGHPLEAVWNAAVDACSSKDFRDPEGDLDEMKYLRYKRNTLNRVLTDVVAAAAECDRLRTAVDHLLACYTHDNQMATIAAVDKLRRVVRGT